MNTIIFYSSFIAFAFIAACGGSSSSSADSSSQNDSTAVQNAPQLFPPCSDDVKATVNGDPSAYVTTVVTKECQAGGLCDTGSSDSSGQERYACVYGNAVPLNVCEYARSTSTSCEEGTVPCYLSSESFEGNEIAFIGCDL